MKTIQATQKPPYNEWITFIYKEVNKGLCVKDKNVSFPGDKSKTINKD